MLRTRNPFSVNAAPVVAVLALALALGGCKSEQKTGTDTSGTDVKKTSSAAPSNTVCPVSLEPVDSGAPTRQYGGKTVGFCCAKCPTAWDKATVADRDAMMAKVAAK